MQRNRLAYAIVILIVTVAGLASRSSLVDYLPEFISSYAGDTLWALAAFLVIGLVFDKMSIWIVALTAISISLLVEISQLYQADWINRIRAIPFVALLLGKEFLWPDLICYTIGVLIGVAGETFKGRLGKNKRSSHNPERGVRS